MKLKDLTTVMLRLYGLYLLFNCVPVLYRFPLHWHYPLQQNQVIDKLMRIDGAITIVLYVAVGALLLRFASKIAEWIAKGVSDNGTMEVTASSLVRMSLAIAGAVFIVHGIQLLVYSLAYWYLSPKGGLESFFMSRPELSLEQKAKIVESVVSILAGLILFLGKQTLVDLAMATRTYGRVLPESDGKQEDGE